MINWLGYSYLDKERVGPINLIAKPGSTLANGTATLEYVKHNYDANTVTLNYTINKIGGYRTTVYLNDGTNTSGLDKVATVLTYSLMGLTQNSYSGTIDYPLDKWGNLGPTLRYEFSYYLERDQLSTVNYKTATTYEMSTYFDGSASEGSVIITQAPNIMSAIGGVTIKGDNSSYYNKYYGKYVKGSLLDSINQTITVCIPYVPEGCTEYKLQMRTKYGGVVFWERTIANPVAGSLVEVDLSFTPSQKQLLYSEMAAEAANQGRDVYQYIAADFVASCTISGATDPTVLISEGVFELAVSDTCPGVVGTVVDSRPATYALTGDYNVLIRYESNAWATMTATPQGAATIVDTGITNNGETYAGTTNYPFAYVESNIFDFYATDNLGETGYARVVTPWIPYVRPTAKVTAGSITGEGSVSVQVSGFYWGGDFGAQVNEIFVYIRYRKRTQSEEEYGDWITLSNVVVDPETNTYVATGIVSGLEYMEQYLFQASIADVLHTVHSDERVVVSIPVFDWSASDFNFNVPVTIQGKQFAGDNPILWEGSNVMAANAVLTLSEAISAQVHGIVLVFSGSSANSSWNTFYVPKGMINFYDGGGHTFLMAVNAALSTFGAKYLYITDNNIVGHTSNQESGTAASGIKFSNANYVLRYVIGV